MSEYATNGAMLVCTCGTNPTALQVTSNTLSSAQGQNIATVSDKAPMANIKQFGPCKMKPTISGYAPCVPVPTAWTGFVASVQMPGGNPLLKTSTIPCGCGGIIQFQDSGQNKSNKVLINPSSPQITALEKAAIEAVPFCEECEKRKATDKGVQGSKKIRAIDAYWIGANEEEKYREVIPDKSVTLYIETENFIEGNTVTINIYPGQGKKFAGDMEKITVTGVVDEDGIAIIPDFKISYES